MQHHLLGKIETDVVSMEDDLKQAITKTPENYELLKNLSKGTPMQCAPLAASSILVVLQKSNLVRIQYQGSDAFVEPHTQLVNHTLKNLYSTLEKENVNPKVFPFGWPSSRAPKP